MSSHPGMAITDVRDETGCGLTGGTVTIDASVGLGVSGAGVYISPSDNIACAEGVGGKSTGTGERTQEGLQFRLGRMDGGVRREYSGSSRNVIRTLQGSQ